jgi:hypothetical protein
VANSSFSCVYSSGTVTCTPSSVTVDDNTTGNITVTLSVNGSGSIKFQSTPITWGSNGQPPGSTIAPPNGGTTQEIITDPNNNPSTNSVSYPFSVNWTYTAPSGEETHGVTDPTIINDGTGNVEE